MQRELLLQIAILLLCYWFRPTESSLIPPLYGIMIRSADDPSLCITSSFTTMSLLLTPCDATTVSQRFNHSVGSRLMPSYAHGYCVGITAESRLVGLGACSQTAYAQTLESFNLGDTSPGQIRPSLDETQCFTTFGTYGAATVMLAPCTDKSGGTQLFFSAYHDGHVQWIGVTSSSDGSGFVFQSFVGTNPTVMLQRGFTYCFDLSTVQPFYILWENGAMLGEADGVTGAQGSTDGMIYFTPPLANTTTDNNNNGSSSSSNNNNNHVGQSIFYSSSLLTTKGAIHIIPPQLSYVNECAVNNGGCAATTICRNQIMDGFTLMTCGCGVGQTQYYGQCIPSWVRSCTQSLYLTGGSYYCNTYGTAFYSGTVCTLTCNAYYEKSGYDVYCDGNGNWAGSGTCQSTGCPPPSNPTNGYFYCPNAQQGDSCSLYCNYGYTQSGSDPVCESSGYFSYPLPTCIASSAQCTTPPTNPAGGYYSCGTVVNGGTCTLYCDSGYYKSGSDPVCDNGYYAQPYPNCYLDASSCTTAPDPPNGGYYSNCYNTPSGQPCVLSCYSGYTKSGSDLVCYDGYWTGVTPTCTADSCWNYPSAPANGNIQCNQPTPSGQSCYITCDDGYVFGGTSPVCYSGQFTDYSFYCEFVGSSTGDGGAIIDPITSSSSSDGSVLGVPVWLLVGIVCFSVMCLVFCFLLCQSYIIRRRKRIRLAAQGGDGYAALAAEGELLEGRPMHAVAAGRGGGGGGDGDGEAVAGNRAAADDELSLRYLGCTPEGVINVNASRNGYGEGEGGGGGGEEQKMVSPWDEDLLRLPLLQQHQFWAQQPQHQQQQFKLQQQSLHAQAAASDQGETGIDDETMYTSNVYPVYSQLPPDYQQPPTLQAAFVHPLQHLDLPSPPPPPPPLSAPMSSSSPSLSLSLSLSHPLPPPPVPFGGYQSVEHLHLFPAPLLPSQQRDGDGDDDDEDNNDEKQLPSEQQQQQQQLLPHADMVDMAFVSDERVVPYEEGAEDIGQQHQQQEQEALLCAAEGKVPDSKDCNGADVGADVSADVSADVEANVGVVEAGVGADAVFSEAGVSDGNNAHL